MTTGKIMASLLVLSAVLVPVIIAAVVALGRRLDAPSA